MKLIVVRILRMKTGKNLLLVCWVAFCVCNLHRHNIAFHLFLWRLLLRNAVIIMISSCIIIFLSVCVCLLLNKNYCSGRWFATSWGMGMSSSCSCSWSICCCCHGCCSWSCRRFFIFRHNFWRRRSCRWRRWRWNLREFPVQRRVDKTWIWVAMHERIDLHLCLVESCRKGILHVLIHEFSNSRIQTHLVSIRQRQRHQSIN